MSVKDNSVKKAKCVMSLRKLPGGLSVKVRMICLEQNLSVAVFCPTVFITCIRLIKLFN